MNRIILNQSLDEGRKMVVEAFKRTEGINKFEQSKYQIVGKTGVSFPRILWSYGESVYVDFSETETTNKVEIEVTAEKEVSLNIGGNAQKFQRRFLDELDKVRNELSESGQINQRPTSTTELRDKSPSTEAYKTEEAELGSPPTGLKILFAFMIATMFITYYMIITI